MIGRWGTGALCSIAALVGWAAWAAPIPGSQKDVAGWSITALDGAGGKFLGCAAFMHYQGGVQMHVGALADGHWQIGWTNSTWNFKVGETQAVNVLVDNGEPFPLTISVLAPTLFAATLPPGAAIFDLLRKGQMLTLPLSKSRLDFTLNGSSAALAELANCHRRYASATGQSTAAAPQPAAPPASTLPASAGMPPEVAAAVGDLQKNCRMMKKEPPPVSDYVTRIDLTGDGVDDWLINAGGIYCAGFSGSGGSAMEIFVGLPNGHARKAFDRYSFGVEIRRGVVWLASGGGYCGGSTNVPRAMMKTCDIPLIWNKAGQRFDNGPPANVR